MSRLEIDCKFCGFSISYEFGKISWESQNAELTIESENDELVGYFKVWSNSVEPETIKGVRIKLEEKADSFALTMKFKGNHKLYIAKKNSYYFLNGKKLKADEDIEIEAIKKHSKGEEFIYANLTFPGLIVKGLFKDSALSLPEKLPCIPMRLRRLVLTITQAEELDTYSGDYEDEKLKRWFRILDEVECRRSGEAFKAIKYARNFVTHVTCHKPETIEFLKKELPESVYRNEKNQDEAKFSRDDKSHVMLVLKYQHLAHRRAIELVEKEVEKYGGNIK